MARMMDPITIGTTITAKMVRELICQFPEPSQTFADRLTLRVVGKGHDRGDDKGKHGKNHDD